MRPEDTEENKKREVIAEMAGANRLDPFFSVSLVEQYAKEFGMDPDVVYGKEFNNLLLFSQLWGERQRYHDRYRAMDKLMNTKQ
jgi:hypothetical protein